MLQKDSFVDIAIKIKPIFMNHVVPKTILTVVNSIVAHVNYFILHIKEFYIQARPTNPDR